MITTYERGVIEGERKGRIEGQRKTVLMWLETKFGSLSPNIKEKVATLTEEQLDQLSVGLVKGQSLEELHLED